MLSCRLRVLGAVVLLAVGGCAPALAVCACRDPNTVGCAAPTHDFLLVEARDGAALTVPKVEVSETPTYQSTREASGVAAIRFPDTCLNDGAIQATGQALRVDSIAQTSCGVWLAELEKALAAAHFRVVSWDALRGLERSKNVPAYVAAQELGADVLFIFNSVEAANVSPGGSAASQLRYFHSTDDGQTGAPFLMTDAQRQPLRAAVQSVMTEVVGRAMADTVIDPQTGNGVTALSSMLDATAVITRSGEAMWFYRNQTMKPVRRAIGRRFLFVRVGEQWHWTRHTQPQQVVMPEVEKLSAEDATQTGVGASRDPYASERLELVRAVAQDFVLRYRNGNQGGN
jgi:hypothetical protein